MEYFALIYYLVDDYLSRRTAFREKHLRLVKEANGRGDLRPRQELSATLRTGRFLFST